MAEVVFESLSLAPEATRFTAVTPPTKRLNIAGMITPAEEFYTPADNMGTYEEIYRRKVMRRWGEWSGDGDLDMYLAPQVMEMVVKGGVTPTTPTSGILTRLGTYVPSITADNLDTATFYWGDPNVRMFQGPGGTIDTLEISSDAGGTEATKWSMSGRTQRINDIVAPALPAANLGPQLTPGNMQVWIDSGATAIGTTLISGRVISATHSIPVGWSYKFPAGQTLGTIPTYTRLGRAKRSIETRIVFELLDMTQWDLYEAETSLKVRVRHNGPLIETVAGPLDYYHYVEVDTYGPAEFGGWGEFEGTNRTIELIVRSVYDSTLGAGWSVKVQSVAAAFA
jgi:hypothetical protein